MLTPKITTSTGQIGSDISPSGRALREFTRRLIATRKAFPILYRSRFLVGSRNEELDVTDVTWLMPTATEMSTEHWQDRNARCFGMLLDGRAQETGIPRRGSDATLLLVFNAHHDVVPFELPDVTEGEVLDRANRHRPAGYRACQLSFGAQIQHDRTIALRLCFSDRGLADDRFASRGRHHS